VTLAQLLQYRIWRSGWWYCGMAPQDQLDSTACSNRGTFSAWGHRTAVAAAATSQSVARACMLQLRWS